VFATLAPTKLHRHWKYFSQPALTDAAAKRLRRFTIIRRQTSLSINVSRLSYFIACVAMLQDLGDEPIE
jgi:hypothetical protein